MMTFDDDGYYTRGRALAWQRLMVAGVNELISVGAIKTGRTAQVEAFSMPTTINGVECLVGCHDALSSHEASVSVFAWAGPGAAECLHVWFPRPSSALRHCGAYAAGWIRLGSDCWLQADGGVRGGFASRREALVEISKWRNPKATGFRPSGRFIV